MKIYKNIKDNKLYMLYNTGSSYMALPYKHNGKPIANCDIKEFIPVVYK
jgi:hypothetical protein